ncbi:MAG TPA: hypothetical protein VI548_05750, partial [Chitinophagaceae bacterium]|nr:hypothetical protein [Chitinophagaceae bacterium]
MNKRRQRVLRQQKNQASPGKTGTAQKTKNASLPLPGIMSNWLLVLILILPFLFSEVPLDSAVAVRHIFLCIFILLFILFFFVLHKRFSAVSSVSIKIVFGLGTAYGLWSLPGMAGAINFKEGYFEISRHLLNLVLLFIIMITVMQEASSIMKICSAVTLVSLAQSFVGILQTYDIAFTDLPGNFIPYGLMTNRNLFGSAQAFTLPFVLFVL